MNRLLNEGWEFAKLPAGSDIEMARRAEWKKVKIPHDWLIRQAKDLYESADAWYRREITETRDETVLLDFDGVYMDSEVYVNGEKVCAHPYGYTQFFVDLSGKLRRERNEVMVHIRHRSPNSRWYSGSGIYRDVRLLTLPKEHLIPFGTYFHAEKKGEGWSVRLSAEATSAFEAEYELRDAEGKIVSEGRFWTNKGYMEFEVENARAWSCEDPYLYTLCVRHGEQEEKCRVGFRETGFDPDHGFFLNGVRTKLKGVCMHHDLGALGAAFNEKAARRQLEIMKRMGVNAIRTSHNPPARQVPDICDEMGILVVDEAFDMWEMPKTEYDYARFFDGHEEEDVASWVRRDRNHPCVIMWSVGNEIYDMHAGPRGAEITKLLRDQVREHDPLGNAQVTFGCNYMPWEGGQRCAEIVKIPGYNYAEKFYAAHHAAHPEWVIYGSETASVLSSRNVYHFPKSEKILSEADLQCSALGNSVSSWGAQDLGQILDEDNECEYSMGQFLWSGFDYIGEPTPYHTRNSYFGQVDTAGFPKDAYFLIQSKWTKEKMIHIGVYWDWNDGQMIDVPVYTNCEKAELFLNGRSLGEGKNWRVPYEKGEIRAVGYDRDGKIIAEDVRRSFGDTAEIRLECENRGDIAFVTAQATDAQGNPVENACDRVDVKVNGCVLMGLDNGDSADGDEYKGTSKRLFGGKMLIIVGKGDGGARVEVCTGSGVRSEISFEMNGDATGEEEILERPSEREIPVRKIELTALGERVLRPENPVCEFVWKAWPEDAEGYSVQWQVTNSKGIESPCAVVQARGDHVKVTGRGDGEVYLRALYGNHSEHPEKISQIEILVKDFGKAGMNPYEFVSAGLYDVHSGNIGAGNEKGIAFAREGGESMVGFTQVHFGKAGSDEVRLSVFTLNDEEYTIDLYDGVPGEGGEKIDTLRYQKKSIWNVYQDESYHLSKCLKGDHTICFVAERKFHLKGFRFEKRKFLPASEADEIYGDHYRKDGEWVREIGNNVSFRWEDVDFSGRITIEGETPMEVCSVKVVFSEKNGGETSEMIPFESGKGGIQEFEVKARGVGDVTLIFLPGSRFDLKGIRV